MKSIKVPANYQNQFLRALQKANLTAEKIKASNKQYHYYHVLPPCTQDQLFRLGIYFNQYVTAVK